MVAEEEEEGFIEDVGGRETVAAGVVEAEKEGAQVAEEGC